MAATAPRPSARPFAFPLRFHLRFSSTAVIGNLILRHKRVCAILTAVLLCTLLMDDPWSDDDWYDGDSFDDDAETMDAPPEPSASSRLMAVACRYLLFV